MTIITTGHPSQGKVHLNARHLLAKVIAVVFLAEASILIGLPLLLPRSDEVVAAIDILALLAVVTPILYFFVIKPHVDGLRWNLEERIGHQVLLEQTLNEFSDCIVLFDKDDKVVFSNDEYHKVFSSSPARDRIIGCTQESLLRSSLKAGLVGAPLAKTDPEEWIRQRLEGRRNAKEGSREALLSTGRTYLSRHKQTDDGGIMVVHTDITERIKNETKLEKTLGEFNAVMNTIQYGVLFLDANLNAIIANKAFQVMWNFPDEMVQRSASLEEFLLHNRYTGIYDVAPEYFETFVAERIAAIRGGNVGPLEMALTDGRTIQYQCIALPHGERMLTYFDITQQKKNEERIRHLANHDALTGLPTLRLASEKMKSAIATCRRQKTKVAVMYMDLDGFKQVNDDFGHDTGDVLLKKVSRKFVACVRDSDTVARIGGDEFLVIQTGIKDENNAIKVAENLIKSLETTFTCRGHKVRVGVSIGIALYPDHTLEVPDLVTKADKAMYVVKKSGKNSFLLAGVNQIPSR